MRKGFFKRSVFLKCLMVLLAIVASITSVQAEKWFRICVKAIDGAGNPASSYVFVGQNYSAMPSTLSATEWTMSSAANWVNALDANSIQFYTNATLNNGEVFKGWYLDEECTQLISTTMAGFRREAALYDITCYDNAEDAAKPENLTTIYGLFEAPINWGTMTLSAPTTGNYYIYNIGKSGFVTLGNRQTYSDGDVYNISSKPDASNALLCTLSTDENDTVTITAFKDGQTWYLKGAGTQFSENAGDAGKILLSAGDVNNSYSLVTFWSWNKRKKVEVLKYWKTHPTSSTGAFTTEENTADDNLYRHWRFIPEQTYLNYSKVKRKKSDGSVSIETPEGSGIAYVSFYVGDLGAASQFDYALPNGETIDGPWELGTATREDNVITVPVIYTAQNVHGNFTTTVKISSKAQPTPTTATATATANVNLQPTFEMPISALNWSAKDEGEEIFNVGMEVAASQRERLQNKLVYSTANAMAQTSATWTATITGANANQFKFSNETQSVTGTYSLELLDVIYAPTAPGTHSATLHIEVSYTDAASPTPHTLTCIREVTLSGKAQEEPMLVMAVNGSETASNNETHNMNIIGTNTENVTVDLHIRNVTNLTKTWSVDTEGVFEFDVNTIDLSQANQQFVIRAHRSTPVTTAEDYQAILTISGEDSNGDPMSAVLTLNYHALPLVKPTVTWNWALLNEDATYTNPLTTTSDGVWTLEQKDGNGGMTYDAETKTVITEYMHHESGYKAKFELNIAQTATYAALTDTLIATIKDNAPAVIEIKNQGDVDTLVVSPSKWSSYLTYNPTTNVITGSGSEKIYFKWGEQSTIMFDYSSTSTGAKRIIEIYEDDSRDTIHNAPFDLENTNIYAISPRTDKLCMELSGDLTNVRFFEYDTIDVNPKGVKFLENGVTTFDLTATFANKRAVTVSLNAAAQEFFELRAEGKPTGSSIVFDNTDGLAVHKFVKGKAFTVAFKAGKTWAEAKAAADNGFQVILQDNYTYNSEVVVLPIALEDTYNVTYKHDAHGTYQVTYHDHMDVHYEVSTSEDYVHTVSSIVETSCTATLSEPTPTSGYMFRGWKVNDNLVSCKATTIVIPASGATVEPIFVATEEAVYGLDNTVFADLDDALSTAGSIGETKPVVVLLKDVTLSEPATHTIPAGVTLLIPYKANFNELQTTPEITTTAATLAAYRTLTLKEGVNLVVNGNICVSAKIMAAGGGNKSAYTTDECGVINMATGGRITLNNGAHLYCWGYIKGQDMDQGNNTVGTGTITVNGGAVVHENFELGDWRGGTASSNIYFEKDDKHLFPFQSYALQNIEIPTTYTFGSKLETFMVVNTGFGSVPFAVSMIGSQNTLFLLKDAGSVIRKWYDPTTDLCCYELSGTAQLNELTINLPFVGEFQSGSCNLPVSNSMHIILADCNMTLSKRLMVQAGAVLEIKNTATVNLEAPVHLFDKDEWGLYIHNYYFRSFNNLTSHKNRGAENSKAGLEDAKFIIDGTLNVKSGAGYIYSTAGGANLMGNGGGKIVFEGALPSADELWQVTVLGEKPYITWKSTPEAAANLCNEDGSYTKSTGFTSYYNIHGRWFYENKKDEQPDHTYDFYYLDNGNAGEEEFASAVYSHDKTGLEARMKWFNVVRTADNCTDVEDDLDKPFTSNWWIGTNPAAFYNYTMLGEWHQFMATETENVYSGSNNVLYHKDECTVTEEGYIDENCLYTIGGVKKALVDGEFIPLTPNNYDPAYYHEENEVKTYYICFSGCNWHPATPYSGESKAYTIHPEDEDLHYIWFNNDWLNVERDGAFFFTADEVTNVRTYYAYVNGEWEVATPYVSVSDAAETRTFYMIKEAFNVASIKKDATITLLRDIPNVTEVLTYTTQNTNCTLDLNGHLLAGNIANLITVNAPGATFTITDNAALKIGKITTTQSKAVYAQKGTVVLSNGTLEATGAYVIEGAATTTITINGGYVAAATQCVHVLGSCSISGGHFTDNTNLENYCAANKYPFVTDDPKYTYEVSTGYTITFKDGGTTLQTLHLKPGEMPQYTAAQPTKDGYKFTGWSPAIVAAVAAATYTAQFEALSGGESCVTLNSNGGNEGLQYVYVTTGSTINPLPAGTTKDGHTFAGWFDAANGGTQITTATTVSADVTWYAHYNKNTYTLTWDANGGNLSGSYTSGSVEFGATITAPTATKDGHTFLGWNVIPASTMPAHDVTYTAQWSIAVKHYLQNIDGTYPAAPAATDDVTGAAGEYVTPKAKTFDGFITPETQTVRIGETDEVRYEYVRRTYTITLDANGGTCATTSLNVKHGATLTLPVATKGGANCSGWFTKAIGGDQITNETEILYNIGTLYAQYADLNVTAPLTVSDERSVSDLRVTTTGSLNVTGSITANNFYLESNGSTASGQIVGGIASITAAHAYFDFKVNAKNHKWYGVAVPWKVDAQTGISVNGKTLQLGKDFDIVYYNGAQRASVGKQKCWSYVEDGDKTLVPGRLYMIGLMMDAQTIRFEKKADASLLTTTTSVSAYAQTTGDVTDANWNGVANPALFHAFVNAGALVGQVYNPETNSYDEIPMNTTKMVVGQGAFVQAPSNKAITVAYGGAYAAPRRARAEEAPLYDVRIAPAEAEYTDRLFVRVEDEKEADKYVIGKDLAKLGVSKAVAQMWINRYNTELCLNTMTMENGVAEYPLSIFAPKAGEYTISSQSSVFSDQYTLYLTRNGEAIWNLSEGAYTGTFDAGTTSAYGLRISARAPQITTGIDEAVVDAKGETRKVVINDKVFIIRGEHIYSADGQLVK